MWTFRTEVCGATNNAQQHQPLKIEVLADRFGKERHASLLHLRFILFSVGFFLNQLSRNRILIDSFAEHQPEVQADDCDDGSGNDKHVQREKARQCLAGDDWSTEHHVNDGRSH